MIKKQTIEQAKEYVQQMTHKVDKNQHERKAIIILNKIIEEYETKEQTEENN